MPESTKQKLKELWHYAHNKDDLMRMRDGTGITNLYHGCPLPYAQALVESGPHLYTVYGVARRVAVVYGLNWSQYKSWAFRAGEEVKSLSTAPALVATRWAWHFPLGEVLTDLNAHARMLVAANSLVHIMHLSPTVIYDRLYNKAIEIGKQTGEIVSSESAPDVLKLENKLALDTREGALVRIKVYSKNLRFGIGHDAGVVLKDISDENSMIPLLHWNEQYFDMHVTKDTILSSRIVVRGLYEHQGDEYEEIVKSGELTPDEMLSWIHK